MTTLDALTEEAAEYRAFARDTVAPLAEEIDRREEIPRSLIQEIARAGLFAHGLPEKLGGAAGADDDPTVATLRQGLVHEALGEVSASVQGLVNVHNMAGSALARWGSKTQKAEWVPRLSAGELVAAFAITEPNVGSDASAVETTVTQDGTDFLLTGTKCWITCGQIADLFVLLAAAPKGPVAFLVPRDTPGLTIEPIPGILGCRGYQLAKLHLDQCRLPTENRLGPEGFGLTFVAATGLDSGRYNLAWGCVGLAKACLDATCDYAKKRRQFGVPLAELQLVQQMISRMMTDIQAARLLCWNAGRLRSQHDPAAIKESTMAKYFASTMVNRVAHDAVQVHGAHGVGPEYPIQRYLRDARIMEIIEGSTQVLELAIARYGLQERA